MLIWVSVSIFGFILWVSVIEWWLLDFESSRVCCIFFGVVVCLINVMVLDEFVSLVMWVMIIMFWIRCLWVWGCKVV